MSKSFRLLISLIASVLSLISMIVGIMLVNALNYPFWRMIGYDLIFVCQFLSFLWCAVLYTRKEICDE